MSNQQKNNIENNILIILIMIVGYMIMDKLGCFRESFGNEKENNNEPKDGKDYSNYNLAFVKSDEKDMNKFCKNVAENVKKCSQSENKDMIKNCNFSYLDVQKCRVHNKKK